ncbi:MBL fold metallo-hydrolase [Eubacterium multiforme]|uniref:Glyoxylase-like metal-dependent hydrolase (Beta-lactamase superfamily II) n=1 Tax=Eubacterium multiforme TaxID=83339 RepID=A0ABT9UUP1_9FIRM|nr:MBL fold metallo-hydrolase [Eubacterium multiforme]MDQ0149999.1 glyoxylase-like metal-dependent hydrolase (beta-lactamase superfamily II) [Eubacterium multiforme]
MIIKTIPAGMYDANCYIVIDEDTKEACILDPGGDDVRLEGIIKDLDVKPKFILLTHGHLDHVGAVEHLSSLFNIPFYVHGDEIKYMESDNYIFGNIRKPDGLLSEDSEFSIGNHKIKVLHTPGHTEGGVCFLIDNDLFSGDTLFKGSIGRTDFTGGDFGKIINSIKTKILPLGDDINVYPGHGPKTSVGYEKKYNPFLN